MQNTTHELQLLHPSLRTTNVALPSDPAAKLTDEELALFVASQRDFIRAVLQLAARGADLHRSAEDADQD